jgi:hypothetical protein
MRRAVVLCGLAALGLLAGCGSSATTPSTDRRSAKPAVFSGEPKAEDVRIEVVEPIGAAGGVHPSIKVVISNVGREPVRVSAWPYVILSDGTKLGRSLTQGPAFGDVEPGKKSIVVAEIKATSEQMASVRSAGVEDVTISRLEGAGSTPQIPGPQRRNISSPRKPSPTEAVNAFVIVPGKSVGPIRLGMTAEEAMEAGTGAWNEDVEVDETLGVVMSWPKANVVANAVAKPGDVPRVFSVRTVNPRFRIKGGVTVGGSFGVAKKLLGKASYYDKMPGIGARAAWPSGVWLDHDTNGRIVCIGLDSQE